MKKVLLFILMMPYLALGGAVKHPSAIDNAKSVPASTTGNAANVAHPITGTVVDENGAPMAGVSVVIKGSTIGTQTGVNGKFTLNASQGDVLIFSFIAYLKKEVKVGDVTTYNVTLTPDQKNLNEVVVTSFGIQKKTNDLGYSLTTVKGDEIDRTNTVNPITALQGKVAGAVISTPTTAGIQTSPFIQIRGANTIGGNNQPIFVIDGNVLYNNLSSPDGADGGSQLKNLNPDDYESITVLKGAAATALYGSRGINGAIVIVTKSGKERTGLGVEFSSTYEATNVYAPFMALQNEFGQGSPYSREGNFAPDGTQTATTYSFGPAYDGSLHPAIYDPSKMVPYVALPDNWKTFYQTGNYVNNNIAISGGNNGSTYRIAYSNTYADGLLPKNALKRNALTLKYMGKINKVFSTELGVTYSNTITQNYYDQSRYAYGGGTNLGFDVYYLPRNTDFAAWKNDYRNADNSLKNVPIDGATGNWIPNAFTKIDKDNYANRENSVLAYLLLKAQVNPWLDFSAQGNVNYYTQYNQTNNYGNDANNAGGQYAIGGSSTTTYDLMLIGHAVKKYMHDDLSVDFRLFNEYYGNRLSQNYFASTDGGLLVPNQFSLSNSVNSLKYTIDGSGNPNGDIGYTSTPQNQFTIGTGADINLNYKQFLNLELTARNDWLSTLTYPVSVIGAANNYSVFYPSANASWSFFDEFKDKMPSWLSSGRLRASWAEVGNAGIAGAYSTSYGYSAGAVVDQNGNTVPTGTFTNGNTKIPTDLKPQIKREIELGTNVSFFKNLITLDVAVYKSNTYNQLLHIPGVPETGYTQIYLNAGNIQNEGIEVSLDVNPINHNNSKNWDLDFAFNMAHNASKVITLSPGIDNWQLGAGYEAAQVYAYPGGPLGILTVNSGNAFKLDSKTGYPIIENTPRATNTAAGSAYSYANYQYEYQSGSNPPVKMGKIEPNLTTGFSTTLRYKSFSLFAQVDARFGGLIYSESYTYAMGQGSPEASLQFRDQAHGGVARTDSYTGKTVYNGAVPNAVFAAGQTSLLKPGVNIGGMTFKQAYDAGLVESWYAPAYYDGGPGYAGTYDWENGINYNGAVATDSWIMLREITIGYNLPSTLLQKVKAIKSARVSVTGRNLGYLYNALPGGQNPESLQSNDPWNPYITGGVPFARTYAVALSVRF
jgi:iron complex outermembrane receptor protein